MEGIKPLGTMVIHTDVDVVPVRELTAELEKAATAAERLAIAVERVKSIFER